jgi:RNA polymerase sigma-70 factor (ECF subfamily)
MPASHGEDAASRDPGEAGPDAPASLLLHHARLVGQGAGGEESFRFVYQACYERVRRFFSRRGYGPEDCRDLTQKTFLRVHQGRATFETTQELAAWLFRIAVNVHHNAQRSRFAAKRRAFEISLEQWTEEHGSAPPEAERGRSATPLDEFLDRERQVVLAGALQELPPKMRRCCLLYFHQEWTHREIAEHLAIAEGTVKAHIHQARKKLGDRMEPYLRRRGPGGPGKART